MSKVRTSALQAAHPGSWPGDTVPRNHACAAAQKLHRPWSPGDQVRALSW